MPGKLFIKTFGCQMNEYDSARMADVLRESHGLTPTTDPEEADVLLLNTCSVREKAQEKVFSQLGVWREFKEQRPHVVIGVGGCVASQEGGAILERAPFVDLVFGPQTLHRLPEMLDGVRDRGLPLVDISFPGDREVRPAAGAAGRRPVRLRVRHGGLQPALHLLRGALHARRGSQPPARRRHRRGRRSSRPRASWKSTCSARTSMPIAVPVPMARRPISRR